MGAIEVKPGGALADFGPAFVVSRYAQP